MLPRIVLTWEIFGCRYGIVLRKRGEEEEAARVLLDSVKAYEFNWSAWMELGQIVKTKKAVCISESFDQ